MNAGPKARRKTKYNLSQRRMVSSFHKQKLSSCFSVSFVHSCTMNQSCLWMESLLMLTRFLGITF